MTEDTGFFPTSEEPPVTEPAPDAETPAEPPADEAAPEAAEPAEDSTEPPAATVLPEAPKENKPLPFIPDTGVADWLREVLTGFHFRLRDLER